jgi:hypothetical protein
MANLPTENKPKAAGHAGTESRRIRLNMAAMGQLHYGFVMLREQKAIK